jgi:hypothetical protein
MINNDSYVEWMCYVLDKDGGRHRFVLHGRMADISERAQSVVDHLWPGGVLQAVEHQGPANE